MLKKLWKNLKNVQKIEKNQKNSKRILSNNGVFMVKKILWNPICDLFMMTTLNLDKIKTLPNQRGHTEKLILLIM